MTAITKRRHAELAGQAMKYVAELLLIEPLSPAFDHKLETIKAGRNDAMYQQVLALRAGTNLNDGTFATQEEYLDLVRL